ncbi:Spore germination protein, GRKB (plasmid) [Clostridium acetobutylicum EA 2018]|nr:Spore germination protein, GRKB [Clostridium acetobutylicum EA 2018]
MGFIWGCGRNLREFIELIAMTVIPHTPLWIILFFFIGLSLYVSVKGFEVFARTTEFIFPTIIFFLIILFALISISGEVHFKNLTPILGDGLKPILKSLPGVVWFPFGEIYVFLMYWHYVNDINTIKKASFKAVILSGILLCFTTMINICTLGAKYTSIATIPLVETLRLINIGDIITHLDVIGVIIIFLGGFFKMTLYLNGIAIIINSVFSIKKSQLVLILTGIFMMYFSIYFEPSFAYHQWMFPFDARYYGLPFALIYPQLLLLIYILKKKRAEL